MKQEEITLRQFQRRFRTERACAEHLFKIRWPDGYRCPKCGHSRYSFHSTRKLYQCCKCKYQVSVTAGTIFHKTRTSLVHWFWAIFVMTRQKSGVSMLSLQGMLGIKSYKTVWTMSHKIRKAMADRDAGYQLTGLVETLQAFLGSKRDSSGRNEADRRRRVEVKVEKRGDSPGFATMKLVPPVISAQGSEAIRSRSVREDRKKDVSALHREKSHPHESYGEVNPTLISDRKTTRVRWARVLVANLIGNIRGVHHGVSEKHLQRYLAEFLYRFNRRAWSSQLLNRALSACVSASTITYAELKI